ncbi:hypothetical protein N657DRAFT_536713, partial [Parathielavia appendiculata]
MSSVAGQAAGGNFATTEQSGTSLAVKGDLVSYSTPFSSQHDAEIKNLAHSTSINSVDRGAGVDQVDKDHNSDIDSLFGDIRDPRMIHANGAKDDENNNASLNKDAHNHSGHSESADHTDRATSAAEAQSSAQAETPSKSSPATFFIVPSGTSANPTSDSPGDFSVLPDGSIPKAGFTSSVLYGPELQKALF